MRAAGTLPAAVALAARLMAQQADFAALYRQAHEERLRSLGPDHPKTAASARDLALFLVERGRANEAAQYLDLALTASVEESLPAAVAMHNWAAAIEETQREAAEALYRRALTVRKKMLPPNDAEMATTRLNLAGLLLARGAAEAEGLARSALAAFERSLGAHHERTGAACGALAAALAARGEVARAEALFRRALAIAERAPGPRSPETAAALENLADLLAQTGREGAAAGLRQRAEAIRGRQR